MSKNYEVQIAAIEFWERNELSHGGMRIHWIWKNSLPPSLGGDGFGTVDIYINNEGKLEFSKETMSNEFIVAVLTALLKAEGLNVMIEGED